MSNKICILTSVHPPFDTRIFHKQAKTLTQAGYDVVLIAQHDRNEVVDGVKIIALPRPRNRFYRIFGLTWKAFFLALKQKADVYHFHDPELLPIGMLLKFFAHAKVIYDVHEDVSEQILTKPWIPALLRRLWAVMFNFVEKLLTRWVDAVVVATKGIAEKFRRLNPIVVHNYPDLTLLPNPMPATEVKKGKVLIYVGGISRIRGAVEMVRALEFLEHIPDLRLDLIGRFEPPELESKLQRLPGYRRVRYLGWMKPKDLYPYLLKGDIGLVCLHPVSRYVIAFPVKLFEYMAAGLPMVASNFPLWKEIVEGNNCGLCVDPLNPKEVAEAIEYLLEHPDLRRKMGENGRRAVMKKYNWKKEEGKLLKLYEELLKQ
jgi:glycosyltransferase involved in cell wall biosynthesis